MHAPVRVQEVERLRSRLFGLAYRMLGSVGDAEDIVQEVAIRYLDRVETEVRAPDQYLTSMTARACIDQLRSARHRREVYVGPWLPEPLRAASETEADPDESLTRDESISVAFLVVLETLSPLERAAFLLHDVFDHDYVEVGTILGRSAAACRQLVSRARSHLSQRRPRFDASAADERRLAEQFLAAARDGDMDGLVRLLSRDATLWCDGGGKVGAAINPVTGADRVARFWVGLFRKVPALDATIENVNGAPAIVLLVQGNIDSAVSFAINNDRIVEVYDQRNPDKLARL
jgi:RNA polymerase sigma-70 factor (ECF subfamily)